MQRSIDILFTSELNTTNNEYILNKHLTIISTQHDHTLSKYKNNTPYARVKDRWKMLKENI